MPRRALARCGRGLVFLFPSPLNFPPAAADESHPGRFNVIDPDVGAISRLVPFFRRTRER